MSDVVELRDVKKASAGEIVRLEVGSWAGVGMIAGPMPGSSQFRFHNRTLGHVHATWDGVAMADLVFSPEAGDALIAAGRADPHPVIPGLGWVSVQMRTTADAAKVIRLFRENYDRCGGSLHIV